MHARSAVIELTKDSIDDAVKTFEEEQIPKYREQDGYKGFTLLVDRNAGKAMGVSFWEDEAALKGSDEVGAEARRSLTGGEDAQASGWEVVLNEAT